jgi:hypothetical protein
MVKTAEGHLDLVHATLWMQQGSLAQTYRAKV